MSFARFLNGALKYRKEIKQGLVKQLQEINKDPKVRFSHATCWSNIFQGFWKMLTLILARLGLYDAATVYAILQKFSG